MPRKTKSALPEAVGFPSDGDEYDDELDGEFEDQEPSSPPPEKDDPYSDIRSEMDALKRENESLRRTQEVMLRAQPPVVTKTEPPEEPDWEELMFRDPKAFAKQIYERAKEDTKREVTAAYQRDQGTQTFWRSFYEKNPDLKGDHDLVEVTLQGNLPTLADMPSGAAADKLADLTRSRILRYTGQNPGASRKKARVEGASSPSARSRSPDRSDDEEDSSSNVVPYKKLGDVIKDRRRKRAQAV